MAEYMFMLFDDESWYDEVTPDQWEATMKLHGEFANAVEAAGDDPGERLQVVADVDREAVRRHAASDVDVRASRCWCDGQ